jgi:hypothetical protein
MQYIDAAANSPAQPCTKALLHDQQVLLYDKPTSPLPSRAPFRDTAELPTTIMSTFKLCCSSPTGLPYFATPADVQASIMALLSNEADVRVEKKPVRRRGCGVSRVLPDDKTSKRTCRAQQCVQQEEGFFDCIACDTHRLDVHNTVCAVLTCMPVIC